jgi:hypothetical protein
MKERGRIVGVCRRWPRAKRPSTRKQSDALGGAERQCAEVRRSGAFPGGERNRRGGFAKPSGRYGRLPGHANEKMARGDAGGGCMRAGRSVAALGPAVGRDRRNCGACHELYRIKKNRLMLMGSLESIGWRSFWRRSGAAVIWLVTARASTRAEIAALGAGRRGARRAHFLRGRLCFMPRPAQGGPDRARLELAGGMELRRRSAPSCRRTFRVRPE